MLDGIEAGIRAELVSTYHGDRDLTDDDLLRIADNVFRIADQIMREDPRGWTSYEGFVGFTICRACNYHIRMTDVQYRKLVDLCMVAMKNHKREEPDL